MDKIVELAVKITRATRISRDIRRGSSVRGAIDLVSMLMTVPGEEVWVDRQLWIDVSISVLMPKIDIEEGINRTSEDIIKGIVKSIVRDNFFE
ncbi:MAG: hypothetical protein ACTSUE_02895 [Promethearchaeota archaeon]